MALLRLGWSVWFGVAAKLLQEMWFKRKLLNYSAPRKPLGVPSCSCWHRQQVLYPLSPLSSAWPMGSPCHRQWYVRKEVRQMPYECSRACCESHWDNASVAVPPTTFLFFFIVCAICRVFRSWAQMPLPSELWAFLFCVASQILHFQPPYLMFHCIILFLSLAKWRTPSKYSQKYWRKCHAVLRLLVHPAHGQGCNTQLF